MNFKAQSKCFDIFTKHAAKLASYIYVQRKKRFMQACALAMLLHYCTIDPVTNATQNSSCT